MSRAFFRSETMTYLLAIGLFGGLVNLYQMTDWHRLPDDQKGYEPKQPIAYSHQQHAGELAIDCRYCHNDVDKGRVAGIPPGNVCMNCHKSVRATQGELKAEEELAAAENRKPEPIVSPELAKLYEMLGLGADLEPDPNKEAEGIRWIRVHNLPDYVVFDHRAHITVGVDCKECHGDVRQMRRIRQVEDLSMGWCVNCHRDANENGINGQAVYASTDCAVCHH